MWARWDSFWFLRIAENGYDDTASTAFYPLYPALVGILGRVFGGHFVVAGIVVSLAACLVSFVLLYRLALRRFPEEVAARSVLFLVVFPTAFFLQAVYSEALFLALALGAFLYAERHRFGAAAALTALAILTRPTGLSARTGAARHGVARAGTAKSALALVAATPAALGSMRSYSGSSSAARSRSSRRTTSGTGRRRHSARSAAWWTPPAPLGGHAPADRRLGGELVLGRGRRTRSRSRTSRHSAFSLLLVGLGYVAWTRIGPAYGVYCAASAALALSVPTHTYPLLSLPRFALVVFPVFLALALVARSRRAEWAIVGLSSMLLALHVIQWVLWRWVA